MSDFETLWTVPRQVPLSMGFRKQEYWSKLPYPSSQDLPDPGIELESVVAPALQVDSLLPNHQGSPKTTLPIKKKKKKREQNN